MAGAHDGNGGGDGDGDMKKKKHSREICAVFHRLAYSIKHLIYSFNSFISTERFSIIHPIEKDPKD